METTIKAAAEFIREHRKHGFSDERIREHFRAHGWTTAHIEAAMKKAHELAVQAHPIFNSNIPTSPPSPVKTGAQPKKYTIRRSLADFGRALRKNWRAFTLSVLAAAVLATAGAYLAIFIDSLLPSYNFFKPHNPSAVLVFLSGILDIALLIAWSSFVSAFLLTTTAHALRDGLRGHPSNIGALLQQNLPRIPRVAIASAMATTIIFGPLLLIVPLTLVDVVISAEHLGTGLLLALLNVLVGVIGVVWVIITMLRLALVQQVAAFEPELSYRRILQRSSFLLREGGQWFLIKGAVLLLLLCTLLSALLKHSILADTSTPSTPGTIVFYLLNTLAISLLTMLYLNRVAVRGSAE